MLPNSHPKPHSVLAQSKDDALHMATKEGLPQHLKEIKFKKEEAKTTSYQCFLHNKYTFCTSAHPSISKMGRLGLLTEHTVLPGNIPHSFMLIYGSAITIFEKTVLFSF